MRLIRAICQSSKQSISQSIIYLYVDPKWVTSFSFLLFEVRRGRRRMSSSFQANFSSFPKTSHSHWKKKREKKKIHNRQVTRNRLTEIPHRSAEIKVLQRTPKRQSSNVKAQIPSVLLLITTEIIIKISIGGLFGWLRPAKKMLVAPDA